MKPIEILTQEHGPIVFGLKVLKKMAGRIESGENVDKKDMEDIIVFIREFADKCHHGKEEAILFAEGMKDAECAKIINDLKGEHQLGRDYVRGMAEATSHYEPGSFEALHFSKNAKNYVDLLKHHIAEEDHYAFTKIDAALGSDVQAEILDRFEKFEAEQIGQARHEELLDSLERLKSKYSI